jgi:predicted 3-demethylubiquinone-9 3-methyltransferase (glyoxalase superfamily)
MPSTATPTRPEEKTAVRSVVPCLTFKDQAEAAVNLYVSVFKNSRINNIVRSQSDGPIPKGKVLHASFELNGREYTAFDGGPHFTFTEGFSLVATCDTQEELDQVWRRLSENGGKEGPCGWLTDPFGVSWQVLPAGLGRMMTDSKSGNPGKAMEALLKMGKLDIATLEKAYKS